VVRSPPECEAPGAHASRGSKAATFSLSCFNSSSIILLTWLYISSFVILFRAAINAQSDKQRATASMLRAMKTAPRDRTPIRLWLREGGDFVGQYSNKWYDRSLVRN
jgi:hypothetical protein